MLIQGESLERKTTKPQAYLQFPEQKRRLFNIYSDYVFQTIGIDDDSTAYFEKIKQIADSWNGILDEKSSNTDQPKINIADKNELFRMISDRVVSQQRVSKILGASENHISLNDKDIQFADGRARAFEGVLSMLKHHPKASEHVIRFLNRRLSIQSIDKLHNDLAEELRFESNKDNFLNRQSLDLSYRTFWDSDLNVRAVIMGKLLTRYSGNISDQIKYVCDLHFPENDKYRKDAELIFETGIMAFEPFERELILAAIASADQNKDDEHSGASKTVGAALRMFFENMGPAWVKFGQLLSYVPELPSEIRADLGQLKDAADVPSRYEIYESINKALPDDLQKNIIRVEEILGAGSFWITAKIKFIDVKTGRVYDKVLSLLRPHARNRSIAGFTTIETAVKNLAVKNGEYKSLLKVAQQAKVSAEFEVDVAHGNKQFEKAEQLYGDISVVIDGEKFTPNVAKWAYYGAGSDAVGYKLMDMAKGKTLDRTNVGIDEKRRMALAYVTIELTNLFKGDVWDIDRHMGQQNFEKIPNGYHINIYDTGAQMPKAPDKTDKILLAEVLYGIIRAARTGIPLDQQILKTIKNMDKLESFLRVDTSYAADVQKGLLALSDIMEYQKEIKDKDGNIIQERLILSAEDLTNAVEAVYDNASADKTIKMSLAGKVLLNKLRPLRKGWSSSLNEGLKKNDKNPIKIEIAPYKIDSNSVLFNKPADEIAAIENAATAEQILGINRKYIKQSPDAITDAIIQNNMREIA
jgi:hypothetical protein